MATPMYCPKAEVLPLTNLQARNQREVNRFFSLFPPKQLRDVPYYVFPPHY